MSEAMITRRGGGGGSGSNLQSKTVSISAVSTNVTPDTGYDGMSAVAVNIAAGSRKAAETFTPGTQAQTIAANKWLTGAQTIRGDANLVASNIKKDVTIFNVTGSYEASGLDTNSAVLKVATSTGCSVTVWCGAYVFIQQDSEGFVRAWDANVTEHFFVIPAAAFGLYSVKSTHPTYGDNERRNTVTVDTAGRLYEVLCGGRNVILDQTFGLQSGYTVNAGDELHYYDAYKYISGNFNRGSSITKLFNEPIPVALYDYLEVSASAASGDSAFFTLQDADYNVLCSVSIQTEGTDTGIISDVVYPTANLYIRGRITRITKIVLR